MSLVLVSATGSVGVITLNRPQAANALSEKLAGELLQALAAFDANPEVGAIVITANGKNFCGGADVEELNAMSVTELFLRKPLKNLHDGLSNVCKPVIAAVHGKARGGGFELAMMCDIIYAAFSATFSLPEVKLGLVPGAGGTQRLTRAVGKAKAMEMILTGEPISAQDGERVGLVAKVFPDDRVVEESIEIAQRIASVPYPVLAMAKEAVNQAQETTLHAGLAFERLLHFSVGLEDAKKGMSAFMAHGLN